MSDIYGDPEFQAYLAHAKKEMFPKMKSSALSVTILTDNPDPKICLELGAAILFDKPLVILVPREMKIPANLKRCAAAIIQGDPNDPAVRAQMQEAITRVIEQDQRAKGAAQ
jgi:hypothetical protein